MTDALADLNWMGVAAELAAEGDTEVIAKNPEAFFIDTMERLEWYGRKLAAKAEEIEVVKANAEKMIFTLNRDIEAFKAHFQPQVEFFVREQLEARGGKSRTLKTLGGSFGWRLAPGGPRKVDGAATLEWAKTNAPEIVRREEIVKEDVLMDAVKDYMATYAATHEGEIPMIPGVEIAPDRDLFVYKAK